MEQCNTMVLSGGVLLAVGLNEIYTIIAIVAIALGVLGTLIALVTKVVKFISKFAKYCKDGKLDEAEKADLKNDADDLAKELEKTKAELDELKKKNPTERGE